MTDPKAFTKIGVISDTHLPESGSLPLRLLAELENVDVILHLGDFCILDAYKDLQKIAPVIAVQGNMDSPELKALLPEKKKIEIQGYNLGLIHGWGPPKNLEQRVAKAFTDVDIILFGHSHQPMATYIGEIFVFNPGSPTMNMDSTGSFGILELGETIVNHIIRLG